MPDEGSFLQAILTNPTDDLPRLVYADWLEEQQTDEANRKAEFLRLTTALVMETNAAKRHTMGRRIAELARDLPTDWLPVVSKLMIENCATGENAVRRSLPQIGFEFECPVLWEALTPTTDVSVRHCDACREKVYYCDTIGQARDHAQQGYCVAVDIALPRAVGDLQELQVWKLRSMGRLSPADIEREREEREKGELAEKVSEERERRRLEKRVREHALRQRPKRK